jgi:transposase
LRIGVLSLQEHLPQALIVYDKFHVLRHASEALDETRRAEFFRQGAEARGLIRGKRWLGVDPVWWTPIL